jgi:hypothetical protein
MSVVLQGDYAYLATGRDGLEVIDVTDPAKPRKAGGCPLGKYPRQVVVAGDYAYVANGWDGLAVVRIEKWPAIDQQSESRTNFMGTLSTRFSAAVSGVRPLAYQWFQDGVLLPGATASAFSITNVQPTYAGAYSVVVTNGFGSTTGRVATLTVVPAPSPWLQATAAGARLTLIWNTDPQKPCVLESSADLRAGTWTPVTRGTAEETGQAHYEEGTAAARRFYRLRQVE